MSKRRAELNERFRRRVAREYMAATTAETSVIDALNDGDLVPLSRFLWREKALTPRLAFFLSLLIRDPGAVSDTKLQIVPKKPRRGRPPMLDPIEAEIAKREIADFVASHESPGWGGAKSGMIVAEGTLSMSRSALNRHLKGRREGARRRVTGVGPLNPPD